MSRVPPRASPGVARGGSPRVHPPPPPGTPTFSALSSSKALLSSARASDEKLNSSKGVGGLPRLGMKGSTTALTLGRARKVVRARSAAYNFIVEKRRAEGRARGEATSEHKKSSAPPPGFPAKRLPLPIPLSPAHLLLLPLGGELDDAGLVPPHALELKRLRMVMGVGGLGVGKASGGQSRASGCVV